MPQRSRGSAVTVELWLFLGGVSSTGRGAQRGIPYHNTRIQRPWRCLYNFQVLAIARARRSVSALNHLSSTTSDKAPKSLRVDIRVVAGRLWVAPGMVVYTYALV